MAVEWIALVVVTTSGASFLLGAAMMQRHIACSLTLLRRDHPDFL